MKTFFEEIIIFIFKKNQTDLGGSLNISKANLIKIKII